MFNKEELKKQLAARFACAIGGMVFYIVTNPGRLAWEIANHGSFLEFAIAAILGFFIVDIFTVALIFLMLGTLLEYLLKT